MSHARPEKSGSNAGLIIFIVLGVLLAFMLVCGGVLAALLIPAITAARGAARETTQRMQSMNNLKQIGLALHNYHDTYNCFPAQYLEDEQGNPRYSWRTAILPFVENQQLFERYDSHRAWDDPRNQPFVSQPVNVFHSPRDPAISGNRTSYLALSGEGTVFDGNQARKMAQITDGTSNTVIVVEVIGSTVPWAKPQDLDINEVQLSGAPGDLDPEGFCALFADGSVRFLQGITLADLRALATRGGNEPPPVLSRSPAPGY